MCCCVRVLRLFLVWLFRIYSSIRKFGNSDEMKINEISDFQIRNGALGATPPSKLRQQQIRGHAHVTGHTLDLPSGVVRAAVAVRFL